MTEIFKAIIEHEFFLSFSGITIWFLLMYKRDKSKKKRNIPFRQWVKQSGEDIALGVFCAFAVVALDDELVGLYNSFAEHDIHLSRYMYLLPGPLADLAYRFFNKSVPDD